MSWSSVSVWGQRPFEREGAIGIAHGDHDGAGPQLEGIGSDVVRVLELKVLLHLAFGGCVATLVVPL